MIHSSVQSAEQLLPAIAYGDSAGLPYEAKSAVPVGSVEGLQPVDNPYLGQHPAGTWSDDTHLSIAVTKSLIEAGGFDLENQAKWHMKALEHVQGATNEPDLIPPVVTDSQHNGWGKSTTESVQRLVHGVHPTESGAANGAGNGVLMKLAPLLLWQTIRHTPHPVAREQLVQLTCMTHAAGEAVVASLVHYEYVRKLIKRSYQPDMSLVHAAVSARRFEKRLTTNDANYDRLSRLAGLALRGTKGELSLNREAIIAANPKGGFYAPETLAMAYGAMVLEASPPAAIYRAVELGGDADSIGSIVATLALIKNPTAPQPHDVSKLFAHDRLMRLSAEFAAAAAAGMPYLQGRTGK
ncbi:MAG TPA: ADP-ribosylglycohydrolase family protein [Candidatus Saccharimonadales bacterium]|nr:ADP-ribosylglycohydrolase family protein [Candidatus Saccharimonadales bacterium]